jgi:DNA repair protein RecO (recombination protein O)
MPNYRTQAINLKSYNLGESDKIIVMYSRDSGILRCIAKGVKRSTSKLGGRMQMLVANDLLLADGKNLDIICQAQIIDSFSSIKNNMTRLAYAFYCAELINNFGLENDTNSKVIYDNLFETLKNISIFSSEEEIIWCVLRFKLKLAQSLGYEVEINNCVKCSAKYQNYKNFHFFCAELGGILCSECGAKTLKTFEIDKRHINLFRDAVIYDFPSEKEHYDKMLLFTGFNILKEFISFRSDKKLKTPEIIEEIC